MYAEADVSLEKRSTAGWWNQNFSDGGLNSYWAALALSTDERGTWLATYQIYANPTQFIVSHNNGVNWSARAPFIAGTSPNVAADHSGNWIVPTNFTTGTLFWRSTNSANSWSKQGVLPYPAGTDPNTIQSSFATDASGTWLLILAVPAASWDSTTTLYMSRSTNTGTSWSPYVQLPGAKPYGTIHPQLVRGATAGRFLLFMTASATSSDTKNAGLMTTNDGGITWSALQPIAPATSNVIAASDGSGKWMCAFDGATAVSSDDGRTWNANAQFPGLTVDCLGTDYSGVWYLSLTNGGSDNIIPHYKSGLWETSFAVHTSAENWELYN